jgi:GT2 family glycosyltransferase
MNPVLILTHNCLELTKKCVESVRAQDVPTLIAIIDNGSTDGTREWVSDENIQTVLFTENLGVSVGWNVGLNLAFTSHEHVLCLNNDTQLPPYFYRKLISCGVPFVTGMDVGMSHLPETPPEFSPLVPHPDFSCFLIRRDCWDKVGPFDERMVIYASDCAYHVESHRKGIPLWKANVPYNHERSSTLNRASNKERAIIQAQANKDREVFKSIYGCIPGEPAYGELFK